MAKKKQSKPRALPLVPPKGPATNLRPAGPHDDPRRKPRAVLERDAVEDSAG